MSFLLLGFNHLTEEMSGLAWRTSNLPGLTFWESVPINPGPSGNMLKEQEYSRQFPDCSQSSEGPGAFSGGSQTAEIDRKKKALRTPPRMAGVWLRAEPTDLRAWAKWPSCPAALWTRPLGPVVRPSGDTDLSLHRGQTDAGKNVQTQVD